MEDESNILTKGLLKGYTVGTERQTVNRAGFTLEISHYEGPEGKYHDEWAADRTGSGQELVETPDGKKYSRVYGGGTIAEEELQKLGLTEKDVTNKLKQYIQQFSDQTRLHADCTPQPDGDWQYEYKIIHKNENIPLDIGLERILFRGTVVFEHGHIPTPVT